MSTKLKLPLLAVALAIYLFGPVMIATADPAPTPSDVGSAGSLPDGLLEFGGSADVVGSAGSLPLTLSCVSMKLSKEQGSKEWV